MSLKYAGPKPLISAHGITFDLNKDDKFIYLSIVAELIQALNHDYVGGERYTHMTAKKPMDVDSILELIRRNDPLLDQEIEDRQKIVEHEIQEELERAYSNRVLCEEERDVLVKNIELLRSYRINRSINKTVYYSGISSLAHIIQKGHIDTIFAPMFPKFTHVFHSIQGSLVKLHPPIDSTIDIYEENGHLNVRLDILFRK
ncbi:MAG: hypothetical protein A2023_03055 [Sulfuricurvum sp. GWF2_44_89]|uniref:Uncharacterized protein n=1 Tax=Sulfuricurvum kujiense TaxID=148813 RepID=A0A2D3WCX0_9BACT|nr:MULTISPECIES: hypothetical protein [Sulfuricurvum]OHD79497.1 MAG: hypothetical protein A2023_03055 [Sulfuricurvum sp. GWF2_44_89]OHD94387.1 MAG: hypothetical protein A2517_09070 [Sulfuricurvum sp. RIFOXYD12_FULL_44_77]OHD95106.1 MAG: hypothetical protein A2552_02135 [Sulfuricurvum sp. RIFOXYD2_FULL_44_160]DAB37745.1 MAG TPA: hypothetical protein CFH83_09580 [Sulfuricurvum kujiense]